jgi:hypothetical protein
MSKEVLDLLNREALARAGCPCGSKAHSACSKAGVDLGALDCDDDPVPPDFETPRAKRRNRNGEGQ